MFGTSKIWALLVLFCIAMNGIKAQNSCVDYDKSLYPKRMKIGNDSVTIAWNTLWNFPNMKQKMITLPQSQWIAGDVFKGLLEYLPDTTTSEKHPLIIFFHGNASRGDGSPQALCRLFKDNGLDLATHKSLPGMVERYTELFTQDDETGTSRQFMVISPQFSYYNRVYPDPNNLNKYPSGNEVEAAIDFIVARYGDKIDLRRIYLAGYSNGANMIMEYVGSSLARAQRVAAVMPMSLCSDLSHYSNAGISASYIGQAKLKTWFISCHSDVCSYIVPAWIDGINAVPGHVNPRVTKLSDNRPSPASLYNCSDTLPHDTWSRAFDPNFKASFVGDGTSIRANDGINLNAYQWLISQTNIILPVRLKNFTARLIHKNVELQWITTDEKDNAFFTIERAGLEQQYSTIGTIPGGVNSTGEKSYSFTDHSPLDGISFYRLVQTDIDGKKSYFDIKKIFNQSFEASSVVVSPNPVRSDISAFISLERSQKLIIALTDINGKVLQTVISIYGQGGSEVKLKAAHLPAGVYMLKVSGENFTSIQKILKK